jgi:ABC-2 type transport system ATP-binding protein
MLNLVRDLAEKKGVSLILSSHLLPDVEQTCERVVVINRGRVVTEGPIASFKQPHGRIYELRVRLPESMTEEAFVGRLVAEGIEWQSTTDDIMRVFVPGEDGAQRLFRLAAAEGAQVRHLRPSMATLEDVFTQAVGDYAHS